MNVPRDKWSLKAEIVELALASRFAIARETWDVATNVFVRVALGDWWGIGEGQPDAYWGETPQSVVEALEAVDLSVLSGPHDLETALTLLPAGSARSALDIALHDLAARSAGISVCELLGAAGRPLPVSSITVPIAPLQEMAARAARLSHWPSLKMKVGFDDDLAAVAAVRDVYDGIVRIDANEGWSDSTEALDRLDALARHDIELCEQPIPAGRIDDLAAVTAGSPIPIFADEDACTARDVIALDGAVHGVNLKLRKAGGLRATVAAVNVARACGMKVMLGCDLETGVASTAAASIAGLVDYCDLDGPLLLAADPYPGVMCDEGVLRLPPGPGLGITA